jgi:outer membrane protein OmpA-like peptidoglycan-associated protein
MKSIFVVFFSLFSLSFYCQDSIVIFFSFNKDRVPLAKLNQLKTKLDKQAISVTKIVGYTDSVGNFYYNLDLSNRRAKSIYDFLSYDNQSLFPTTEIDGRGEVNFEGEKGRKVVVYYNQKISYQIRNAKVGENLKINNLNFEPGTEILLPGSIPVLTDLLKIMNEFPNLVIAIEGHICCDINDETNLSTTRAKVIYDYLVQYGIKSARLSFRGFGSTKPIYKLPEQNDLQQVSNRRVEIRVISKN